ncbi:MAG: dodecin flavoprotein [Gemmatimonadetes bacterium]|nr:dodecin flavoprotein [Gemmatimonadota bacterium]
MGNVHKSLEVVGTSESSFDDAVRVAVKRAGQTVRNLEWLEVVQQRGYIRDGEVREFQATVKLWFRLDES